MSNEITTNKDIIISNIVPLETLRSVQLSVIEQIAIILQNTYGPNGSDTLIIKGSTPDSTSVTYSKDGHTVLKNIKYAYAIETSIQSELEEITRYMEKEVGDGTTTVILMAYSIFRYLCEFEQHNTLGYNSYELFRNFKNVVEYLKNKIMENRRDVTLEDLYKISYISTNGNKDVANQIYDLYVNYGTDLYITVESSVNNSTYVREYDGATLEVGYSDPMYINSHDGTKCILDNPQIYAFKDPVDTPEMITFFEKILMDNIIIPFTENAKGKSSKIIPTVIVAPRLSRDMSALFGNLATIIYKYETEGMRTNKPPFCIVTNIGPYEDNMIDIMELAGCKFISKYINFEIQESDKEKGLAPTLETIHQFAGSCEQFIADDIKSSFINPRDMYDGIDEATGDPIPSDLFISKIHYLESICNSEAVLSTDVQKYADAKRRLNTLKSNMVELYIGGVSDSDRNSLKDLVSDAILNCRSAIKYGVGYAASYEGFMVLDNIINEIEPLVRFDKEPTSEDAKFLMDNFKLFDMLYESYQDVIYLLYKDYYPKRSDVFSDIKKYKCPMNIHTKTYDNNVICSIRTEIAILESISQIIMKLFTSNQAILPSVQNNIYIKK